MGLRFRGDDIPSFLLLYGFGGYLAWEVGPACEP